MIKEARATRAHFPINAGFVLYERNQYAYRRAPTLLRIKCIVDQFRYCPKIWPMA